MAIIERKQLTGTTEQINAYAGHNGQLAFDKTTKHLHVLSGTAGTTTKLANADDIPAPVDISGKADKAEVSLKADKTYVDEQLATKQPTGDYATNTALTTGLAGKANAEHSHAIADVSGLQAALNGKLATTAKIPYSQITGTPSIPDVSGLIPKTGNRGSLVGYEMVTVESESAVSVTKDTPDVFLTSGAITAPSFSEWNECWTKVGALLSTSPLVTLKDGWVWSGGVAPTLHQYDLVVFNKTRGLCTATLVARR